MGADRYLCLPELSTGFRWSETAKRWNQENFATDITKYLVEQSEVVGQEDSFIVKQIGSDYPAHNSCKRRRTGDGSLTPLIVCGSIGYAFMMNVETLRYQEIYTIGFIDGLDRSGDTPSLTIGRCSSLD